MKKSTAVIIVDMQEFFLKNFPVSVANELIENQKQIINLCLKKKCPFILLEYKAGGVERGETITRLKKVIKGSVAAVIVKESNSGFTGSNLDLILKSLNIRKVLLMGLNANGCVQDTAIGAIRRGYQVITAGGVIAGSSRKDLTFSKRNKKWFEENTRFFEDPKSLLIYLS